MRLFCTQLTGLLSLMGLFSGCLWFQTSSSAVTQIAVSEVHEMRVDTLRLWDAARRRAIPVALFHPATQTRTPVVVMSHGYGANQGDRYLMYQYLTRFLAEKGYAVVSIQHELPTDDLIPTTGTPQVVRRPFWERGAENIRFVLKELPHLMPNADLGNVTLIGHSNGGDMSVLLAHQSPALVRRVISLDSRRMPFPLQKQPRLFSLRSSDQQADEGVLPNVEAQQKYGIQLVELPNVQHNDMDDSGTPAQHAVIQGYVLRFLKTN